MREMTSEEAKAQHQHQQLTYVIPALLTILSTFVVGIRIFTRRRYLKYFGIDDFWIVVALIFAIVHEVLVILAGQAGMGAHVYSLPLAEVLKILELGWIMEIFYQLSMGFTKISLLSFYLRIFVGPRTWAVVLFTYAFIVSFTLVFVILMPVRCLALDKDEDVASHSACFMNEHIVYSISILDIITDIWVWALPIPAFTSLNIKQKQKILLCTVFSFGGSACITSILRLVYMIRTSYSADPTWNAEELLLLSAIEINLGIIAASVPALKPLFEMISNKLSSNNNNDVETQGTVLPSTPCKNTLPMAKALTISLVFAESNHAPLTRIQRSMSLPGPVPGGASIFSGSTETTIANKNGDESDITSNRCISRDNTSINNPTSTTQFSNVLRMVTWDGSNICLIKKTKSIFKPFCRHSNTTKLRSSRPPKKIVLDLKKNDFCLDTSIQHQLPLPEVPTYRKKLLSKLDSYHHHHYLGVDLELDVDTDDLEAGRGSLSIMEEEVEIQEERERGRRESRRESRRSSWIWLEDLERRRDSRRSSKAWIKDTRTSTDGEEKEDEKEPQTTERPVRLSLRERRSSSFK